jgi:hypothetical protein
MLAQSASSSFAGAHGGGSGGGGSLAQASQASTTAAPQAAERSPRRQAERAPIPCADGLTKPAYQQAPRVPCRPRAAASGLARLVVRAALRQARAPKEDDMSDRFVWYELMTTDTKGAMAFYGEVVGWKTEPFPQSKESDPYTMWVGGQGPMGGVMTLPDDVKKMGVPPHWMGHVGVANVDATVAAVTRMGGSVKMPPMDIPSVGRFSVVADPQGAVLSVFQSEREMAPHDTSKQGEVSWNELITSDAPAALTFYTELFGWKVHQEMDMGPMGKYFIYGGDKAYGGMMTKTPDMPMPPAWIYYFQVDDLDAALARATAMGAKTLVGPMDVPGGTRIAQFTDPQGAVFALHGPGKPAQ